MLAKSVVRGYGAKAEFVEENFSESALAKKFGIKFYPAVFVDEVLIAKPSDFFGNKTGRYIPWREPKNQEKFRADLTRMIDIAMRDRGELVRLGVAPDSVGTSSIPSMPEFSLTDLSGKTIATSSLRGKATLVEFWAEWCPPCRSTLAWLAETHRKHADTLHVLGVAVESEEASIRAIVHSLNLPYPNVMGSAEIALLFGDIVSVPTLFVFDRTGKTVSVFYGAPPDLHEQVGQAIALASG
ncbi:MAG: TlpA family protein disulfide reductase [Vicinamibacteria bacterium]|nr:TlpA family protein disulfide reductase [Vicinamibacteria bacterium]